MLFVFFVYESKLKFWRYINDNITMNSLFKKPIEDSSPEYNANIGTEYLPVQTHICAR